jgi:signal recognition particle receptor subunit beta
MALVNHAKKEINAKIVYYGPAESGKSTALTYIYSRIKPSLRGELKSVPAGADNLLFFDFSPFEIPLPNGYRVRLHVYTLTGTVNNPATWKMTLKGADGIIIMVNAAAERLAETRESVARLRDFLSAYGVGIHDTPSVLLVNNFSPDNQQDKLNTISKTLDLASLQTCYSNVTNGEGLLEALTTLSRQVLDRVKVQEQEEQYETDIASTHASPADSGAAVVIAQEKLYEEPEGEIPSIDTRVSTHIALLNDKIIYNNDSIRIPIEIIHNESARRIVITVNVDME